jgi:exonuclease III
MKCIFRNLTVGSWNIEGIYEKVNGLKLCKLEDPSFLKVLNKFDILCLQETHVAAAENIPIPEGFCSVPHCRSISGNSRYFGGFLILIRKSIQIGIKIGKNCDNDAFEVTL